MPSLVPFSSVMARKCNLPGTSDDDDEEFPGASDRNNALHVVGWVSAPSCATHAFGPTLEFTDALFDLKPWMGWFYLT